MKKQTAAEKLLAASMKASRPNPERAGEPHPATLRAYPPHGLRVARHGVPPGWNGWAIVHANTGEVLKWGYASEAEATKRMVDYYCKEG